MIGLMATNEPWKNGPEKYQIKEVEVKAYLNRTRTIYYIVSEFCEIGPFYIKTEALYWKLNLEKVK